MKIALIGYGNMGKAIEKLALEKGLSIICCLNTTNAHQLENMTKGADVCMEFTKPESAIKNIEMVARLKIPIVIGTTGWYDKLDDVAKILTHYQVGGIWSENYSTGLQCFLKILDYTTLLMNTQEKFDVSAFEVHHRQKVDSPSGTAREIAKILLHRMKQKKNVLYETTHEKIDTQTLHFPSLRCGHMPGTHKVLFDSPFETLTLSHEARNREALAEGALMAAKWVQNKTGLYHMRDFL